MAMAGVLLGILISLLAVIPAVALAYLGLRAVGFFESLGLLTRPLGIDWRASLLPTVAFLGGIAWLTIRTSGTGFGLAANTALVTFGLGLLGVAAAIGNLGRYRQLRGEAVATGTTEPDGATTAAPFSGEPCVAWAVRVREHGSLVSRRLNRVVVHEAEGGEPFSVRGAVEATRIDPEAATLEVWPPTTGREGDFVAAVRDGALPDRVTAYADAHGLGDGDRSRVYEEVRIEPGDPVTVIDAADGNAPRVLNAAGDDVRASVRRRVRSGLVGGPVAAVSFLAAAILSGAV